MFGCARRSNCYSLFKGLTLWALPMTTMFGESYSMQGWIFSPGATQFPAESRNHFAVSEGSSFANIDALNVVSPSAGIIIALVPPCLLPPFHAQSPRGSTSFAGALWTYAMILGLYSSSIGSRLHHLPIPGE